VHTLVASQALSSDAPDRGAPETAHAAQLQGSKGATERLDTRLDDLLTTLTQSECVVGSLRAAAELRTEARSGGVRTDQLAGLLAGDAVSRAAALHALGASPEPSSTDLLLESLDGDRWSSGHATWALADHSPVATAAPMLARSVGRGGFGGFLAELALESWAGSDVELVNDALSRAEPEDMTGRVAALARSLGTPVPGRAICGDRGQVIAQLHLHASLDGDLRSVGRGASGGLTTLAVNLAVELAHRPDVHRVLTISRSDPSTGTPDCTFVDGATIRPIALHRPTLPAGSDTWTQRLELEALLTEALSRDIHPDVIHLRMADVATLAGWRVARRLGLAVVFTAAADPHTVMEARQRAGELDRRTFPSADLVEHLWFRTRLVEDIADDADHLVLFPRANVTEELAALTGVDLTRDRRPWSIVPEGVSIRSITATAETLERVAEGAAAPEVVTELARALDALPPERRRLPLLVSVGRLHQVKGMDRFVSAWDGCPALRARFNAVIIGGSLDAPDPDEASVLAALRAHGGPASGLILLGNRSHADTLVLLRAVADGVGDLIPRGGVYVCASAKEEFGLAILEAIASGLPVVAPADGGPPTYIADGVTGIVCDTSSVQELAVAILRAAALPPDAADARWARKHLAEDLTLERTAAHLTVVYRDATRQRAA